MVISLMDYISPISNELSPVVQCYWYMYILSSSMLLISVSPVVYIWANYNNSLTWIKAIWDDFPYYDFQWARSELVIIYPDIVSSSMLLISVSPVVYIMNYPMNIEFQWRGNEFCKGLPQPWTWRQNWRPLSHWCLIAVCTNGHGFFTNLYRSIYIYYNNNNNNNNNNIWYIMIIMISLLYILIQSNPYGCPSPMTEEFMTTHLIKVFTVAASQRHPFKHHPSIWAMVGRGSDGWKYASRYIYIYILYI